MRAKKYLFCTLKQVSSEYELISNNLMLRAGMIRKLSSGIYTWLPTGIRVLKKIENIIRDEMKKIGFVEIFLPIMQPINLWKKSDRINKYGSDLFKIIDRNKKIFVLSPTNEEIITHLIKNEINSYKDLPINLFQIQTKFRDEIRPRFGVIRSREFIMKDGYSFHENKLSLETTYFKMYNTYIKIFNILGIKFKVIKADTGNMGGNISHEFQSISKNKNLFLDQSNLKFQIIDKKQFIKIPIENTVKTLVVKANKKSKYKLIALLIRGDHILNIKKAEEIPILSKPLKFANKSEVYLSTGVSTESIGPIGLKIPIIADIIVSKMKNFTTGANIQKKYFFGVNWEIDLSMPKFIYNIHSIQKKEIDSNKSKIKKGIEIGHIFQLGNKYSKSMGLSIQNKNGLIKEVSMGCYGIGITRIISAIIEQNFDTKGIIWPNDKIAPFTIAIIPINMHNSDCVKKYTEDLYKTLIIQNIDVILDDRQETLGVMFADMELIGVPHLFIISDKNIKNNVVEYKNRKNDIYQINLNKILEFINTKILKIEYHKND